MVGFSTRVWRERQRANGSVLTDLPFQLTWETSRLQSGGAGILTNFTGGAHGVELGEGTVAEQAARLVADLELHFAGEHCSRYAQGFMEGGCETGERAARAIAEARGQRIGSVRRLEPRRLLTPSTCRAVLA